MRVPTELLGLRKIVRERTMASVVSFGSSHD